MYTEVLRGQRVVLVPSTPDHVERYYRWMTDPRLLRDTGTDPLTLEEVYEMEKHWREDDDKLTFIILANGEGDLPMIGDVNIFLKGDPHDEDFEAEVGVMIAEESYRGKGLALEALRLMLSYVTASPALFTNPSPTLTLPNPPFPFPIRSDSLAVRIGQENRASTRLFERLGFVETRGANAFGEKEMRIRKDT
ncbi:GNAT domain-containing protein [Boletus edulis BED1]|uniref:GNAT domain-containing protein n=1 Tax=Boletus edulis BED1 TaxID=1328754 RepID=A0AAD4BV83_BOLED|nr:GNAT domain-containing protein [Boletus edulis BED1]